MILCIKSAPWIYILTVNNEESMRRVLDMNTDGIVTDDPAHAKYLIQTRGKDKLISTVADKILGEFAFPIRQKDGNIND